MSYTLDDGVIYLEGERIGHGNSETLEHLKTITGACDKPKCPKCKSTKLTREFIPRGQYITGSARHRHTSPFVHSSEYDFFWKWTAAKDHFVVTCSSCGHKYRAAVDELEWTDNDN